MRVDVRAPVTAETLAWDAPEPRLTLVVKSTFELTPGTLSASRNLLPIRNDVEDATGVRYASDRVPWKASPEIVVVGHARAPAAHTAIRVTVSVGASWSKTCVAYAAAPTTAISLGGGSLRSEQPPFETQQLGPSRAQPAAWLQRQLPAGFNFTAFNSAPQDQRVPSLDAGAPIALEGLVGDGSPLRTRLPTERPQVFLKASAGARPRRLETVCDTCWIDSDERLMCLVWRVAMARPSAGNSLVVGWGDGEMAYHELDEDTAKLAPRKPRAPAVTLEVDDDAVGDAKLPFVTGGPSRPPPLAASDRLGSAGTLPAHVLASITSEVDEDDDMDGISTLNMNDEAVRAMRARAGAPLPFSTPDASAKRRAPEDTLTDEDDEVPPLANALPFSERAAALPPHVAAALAAMANNPGAGNTLAYPETPVKASLPFAQPAAQPAARPPSPGPVPHDTRAVVPPTAPQPAKPIVPQTPQTSSPAAAWLALPPEVPAATPPARPSPAPPAQPSPAPPAPAPPASALPEKPSATPSAADDELDLYITVRDALDASKNPVKTLKKLGMTTARWGQIRREWTKRSRADPKLATTIREKLAKKRRERE